MCPRVFPLGETGGTVPRRCPPVPRASSSFLTTTQILAFAPEVCPEVRRAVEYQPRLRGPRTRRNTAATLLALAYICNFTLGAVPMAFGSVSFHSVSPAYVPSLSQQALQSAPLSILRIARFCQNNENHLPTLSLQAKILSECPTRPRAYQMPFFLHTPPGRTTATSSTLHLSCTVGFFLNTYHPSPSAQLWC